MDGAWIERDIALKFTFPAHRRSPISASHQRTHSALNLDIEHRYLFAEDFITRAGLIGPSTDTLN